MAPLSATPSASGPEALVLGHRRLARHLAQRYVRGGDQSEDLEQVAYLGLVKAARRFDPDRGVAFTTFAVPTVLGELRRFCRDTRWAAHVPRAVQERVQALRRLEDEHRIAHGRAPSAAEAARALQWSEEEVLEARLAAGCLAPQSLNASIVSSDGTVGEAIDAIGSEDTGFEDAERRDELQRALAHLRPAEQQALRLRGEGGCTTPEIARRMGLSRSQAGRLVATALAELRAALGAHVTAASSEPVVRLVDADAALFAALDSSALTRARRTAIAPRLRLEPGGWDGPEAWMLVVSGALLRTVALDGHPRAELIGPGDVVRGAGDDGWLPGHAAWQVIEPVDLALLDRRALRVLCEWPSVMEALLTRASERSNGLAVQLAITDQRRVDDRLLSLFRMLSDRWGRRTARGVDITLPLTHDTIAMLVGAHRPTVTSALQRLSRAGRLRRVREDRWLLADVDAPPLRVAA